MAELKLQNMKTMTGIELEIAIKNCFDYSPQTTPVDRLAVLQEAQFYTRELECRNDAFIAKRDLWLEIAIIVLITAELLLGFYEGAKQSTSATKQQQVLSDLQSDMALTAKVLTGLEKTTEKMNEGVQKELELYYEPSVLIAHVHQNGGDVLEIHNYARTRIAIFGIKARNDVCSLERPINVSSNSTSVLESIFVMDKVVRRVETSDANTLLTLYFKAENGHEFKHEVLVVRLPVVEGIGVSFERQNTQPMIWDSELAQSSLGKCPE